MKKKELNNDNIMTREELVKKIDFACFMESHDSLISIYYRIYKKLPAFKYVIDKDNVFEDMTPKSVIPDEFTWPSYIDLNATHEKLKRAGFVPRIVFFTNMYFREDNTMCLLYDENITVFCDDKKYIKEIQKAIVNSKDENNICVGFLEFTGGGEYSTEYISFDKMDIDIDKTYNDDINNLMPAIDKFIKKDKTGVALFYGEPGTGKTTFIKYLIQTYKNTNFIILDSDILNGISSRNLMNYLVNMQNAVFIIEDAEKLLKSRNSGYNPVIGTFLNLSDGILASSLKCKFICTFNTEFTDIDPAISRKGRMKANYEFKKLSADKVSKLTNGKYKKAMTVAEIFNEDDNDFSEKEDRRIGFN